MTSQLRSGFVQFLNLEVRQKFVETVLEPDAELKKHAYSSSSQPTVAFEALTDHDCEKVKSAVKGLGRWFEDVQFEPMTKP